MTKKLTLSLDDVAIEQAKAIAKKHHTSVSKMVENYFLSLNTHPPLKSLSNLKGSLKGDSELNEKTTLKKILKNKYL